MSLQFFVVHEAVADFVTATELADRVLVEVIDWMDSELVTHLRTWHQTILSGEQLTWKRIKQLARNAEIEDRGFFDGQPAFADAVASRRAILYLKATVEDVAGIVLVRDQDDQHERRKGLEQARKEHPQLPIVVGLAVVEREAWAISGFEPQDTDEQTRLDVERQTLGFYPHERSHELTACKDDTASRSPKRVLRALTGGDFDRERQCWTTTSLARLRERGTENGLVQFLEKVRTRLAPSIGHVEGGTES